MKLRTLISVLLLSVGTISCIKPKKTTIDIPEIKKMDPVIVRKSGLKCNLLGVSEQKEIFLKLDVKDGKQTVSFHDFIDANRVSIVGATIEGYRTLSYELTETIVNEEKKVSIGSSVLLPSDELNLNIEEGRVITSSGRLTVDYGFRGQLEVSHVVKTDEGTIKATTLEELAKIEACDRFEAIWL
jgi:hypothetical protein